MTGTDRRTIMVVDDEPHIVRFTAMNLEVEGYNVVTAENGARALEKLDHGEPVDLVVLDVMMPEMDGFETLRRIRSVSSVPVIFVTVRGDESDRVAGLDLGRPTTTSPNHSAPGNSRHESGRSFAASRPPSHHACRR